MSHSMTPPGDELDRALDAELGRALRPPQAPPQLRSRLAAAIAREADLRPEARARIEREHRERLTELKQHYVRLRRRTLGLMVGGAFASGAAAALAMPWLTANVGSMAPLVVASAGAVIGIGIAVASWLNWRSSSSLPV
jgi:hypothetical protein